MPLSSVNKQTAEVLDDVLLTIRQEYENPFPVLSETDRSRFVEDEESLREQLKDTVVSDLSSWRGLLCLPSPQAVKCLKNAQELRQRVKDDINTKLRTRLTGKSNPSSSPSWPERNSAMNPIGTSTPKEDGPLSVENPWPATTTVTSPLNMRCSLPGPEFWVNSAAVSSGHNGSQPHTPNESSGQGGDSSARRRRTPPLPPLRRMSHSSLPSSVTSSNSSSDSPRHSTSVRRPAPPPPQLPRQSRAQRSPINASFISTGPLPPDLSMLSSLPKHLSTIVTEATSGQALRGRSTKTNCLEIIGSNVDGVTLNNGGKNNSGAVIHKTAVAPSRPSRHAPQP